MFDVGWSEMLVIGVVALVVIGPRELPGVIRSVGKGVSKLRTMAGEFRSQFDSAMREAELDEVKKTFTDVKAEAEKVANFDPLEETKAELSQVAEDVRSVTDAPLNLDPVPASAPTPVIEPDIPAPAPIDSSAALRAIEADAAALEAEIRVGASDAGSVTSTKSGSAA